MKKWGVILICILCILFLITGVLAADLPKTPQQLNQATNNYLKQEWSSLLAKTKLFRPIIEAYNKISPTTDPIFKYTIGMAPELSWLFVIHFLLWIVFLVYMYQILSIFSTFQNSTSLVIAVALSVIMASVGLTGYLSNAIVSLVGLTQIWWVQLIFGVVVIIALIIASIFSKQLQAFEKVVKANKKKEEEAMNRARLKVAADKAEKYSKALEKALQED